MSLPLAQQCSLINVVYLQVQNQLVGAGIKADLLEFWMERRHEAWLHRMNLPRLIARPTMPPAAPGMHISVKTFDCVTCVPDSTKPQNARLSKSLS